MLVLGEKINGVNVLHIVIGPETNMQFNLQGHSSLDISEYISEYKPGEKCMISINRCDSEERVIQMLEYNKTRSKLQTMMDQVTKQINEEVDEEQAPPQKNTKSSKQSDIPCPLCSNPNSAIVRNGKTFPCAMCQKIEAGLATNKVPPAPSIETLEDLRKKLEQANPEQKKSIFKFYKKEEKKEKKRGKNDNPSNV